MEKARIEEVGLPARSLVQAAGGDNRRSACSHASWPVWVGGPAGGSLAKSPRHAGFIRAASVFCV